MNTEDALKQITFGPEKLPLDALDFFEMSNDEKSYEVMLVVFRSKLGTDLQDRTLTREETDHVRATVGKCDAFARTTESGVPQEYFVEFADGDADYFGEIAPEHRSVFGLKQVDWQTGDPMRMTIS